TVPSTPATVCASTCSTMTPATSSGISSSVWSESCGDDTPRKSPSSPTSSSSTELEVALTQLDPSAGHQGDERAKSSRNDVGEKPHASVSGTGPGAGTLVREGNSADSRRAKRRREDTPRAYQYHHAQDSTGHAFPSVRDEQTPEDTPHAYHKAFVPELAGGLGSARRKVECFARSQFPRLEGHSTLATRSHCKQLQQSDLNEGSVRSVQGDATGGIFHGALGSQKPSSRATNSQGTPERADRGTSRNEGGNASENVSAETLPAQDSMDTCEASVGLHLPDFSDQCDGDLVDFNGVQVEASPTGYHNDAASSRAEQSRSSKASRWLVIDERSSQVPKHAAKPTVEDPKEADAVDFRRVRISGDEDWECTRKKLKQLGWTFPRSTATSSKMWILRPRATVKKAQPGVDKFEGREKLEEYVREALQLSAASQSDRENEDQEDMGEERDGVERGQEQGAGDEGRGKTKGKRNDVEEHEQEESDGPKQVELSASVEKGRALQAALEALNPSNAPDVLQQRTTEFKQVLQFVTTSVTKSSGGSLYLCGVPGTGKTQTMVNVQAKVLAKFSKGKTPAPAFHSFTGTEFTSPTAMHDALWRAIIGGKQIGEGIDMEKQLDNKLRYHRKRPTATSPMLVVVLDEIDQLMTHNRQVLRKLFEWADAPKSRLILVGLANSLEFDVNFSHLDKAPQRLLFQSYTPEDLASILTQRVGATVHHSAIQFCAKKAAATTGDARRAINMCREAVVLAKQELQNKLDDATSEDERLQMGQGDARDMVTIGHMAKAVAAGNAGKYSGAIAGLSFHAKVVLAVAAAAVRGVPDRRGGKGANAGKCPRLSQGDLHEKCMGAWRRLKTGEAPGQLEFTVIIDLLVASGLVALKSKQQTGGRARELVLRIEFADLAAALEDQPFFKTVTGI
ncbi:unnamed protein product, partial [Hapterophycus canaliculatus]